MSTSPGPQNTFQGLLQNLIFDIIYSHQSLRSIVGSFLTDFNKMLYTSFFLQSSGQVRRPKESIRIRPPPSQIFII